MWWRLVVCLLGVFGNESSWVSTSSQVFGRQIIHEDEIWQQGSAGSINAILISESTSIRYKTISPDIKIRKFNVACCNDTLRCLVEFSVEVSDSASRGLHEIRLFGDLFEFTVYVPVEVRLKRVNLLAINDFHGRLSRAEKLANFVEDMNSHFGDRVANILISAGDNIGGSEFESLIHGDQPTLAFLNHLGLEISCIGNHEFDGGREMLDYLLSNRDSTTKYVASNVVWANNSKNVWDSYTIWRDNEISIAFVGALTDSISNRVSRWAMRDLRFLNMSQSIFNTLNVPDVFSSDAIVTLVHEGVFNPPEIDSETDCDSEARCFVPRKPDAIITGHTHRLFKRGRMVQGGAHGSHVVVVTLAFEVEINSNRTRADPSVQFQLISMENYRDGNLKTSNLLKSSREIAAQLGDIKFSVLNEDILKKSLLGNYFADALEYFARIRGIVNSIGLINLGTIRTGLKKGDILIRDLFNVLPFGNIPCIVELTGYQIKKILRNRSDIIAYSQRIDKIRDFVDHKMYNICTTDYVASGGDGILPDNEKISDYLDRCWVNIKDWQILASYMVMEDSKISNYLINETNWSSDIQRSPPKILVQNLRLPFEGRITMPRITYDALLFA